MRSISFSEPMVPPVLADTKLCTRRLTGLKLVNENPDTWYFQSLVLHASGRYTFAPNGNYSPKHKDIIEVKCPYGKVGDELWVREAWRYAGWDCNDGSFIIEYKDGTKQWCLLPEELNDRAFEIQEQLTNYCESKNVPSALDGIDELFDLTDNPFPWKPSIHMFQAFSRIKIQITGIELQRLRDISDEDAVLEGIENKGNHFKYYGCNDGDALDPKSSFATLIKSIHGEEIWSKNPWVWVVRFKRVVNH